MRFANGESFEVCLWLIASGLKSEGAADRGSVNTASLL